MVYRIKRKSDGMYSTGGHFPTWSTEGKWWRRMGDLRGHLAQFKGYYNVSTPYVPTSNYEIEVSGLSVTGYLRMEDEFNG